MTLEETAKVGNIRAMDLCRSFLDTFGSGGVDYECAVSAAATALLVHAFRIASSRRSTGHGTEVLSVILSDVTFNIKQLGGDEVSFSVQLK